MTTDISAREKVGAEFEVVWARSTPGNQTNRAIAKYWFRSGRDCGLAAHAALERSTIKELNARIQVLERSDVAALVRREKQLIEALAELNMMAHKLRHSAVCGTERKRDLVRIDLAMAAAGKLTQGHNTKVTP